MADEITLDAPETRIERFLAAAAGVEGITLDEPETRIEKYLYKIAQGSGGVPPVEDADKGKYLHANESTGALEWAEGGSGGGELVEIKTDTSYASATCSHTKEQLDAIREAKGIVNAVITVQDGKGFFSHLPAMFMPNYTGSGYEYNISAVRWNSSNMSDFKLRKIVANVSTLGNVTISKANQT